MIHFPRRDVYIALIFYALNIFDMVATMIAVKSGYGMELNPFMRFLMEQGMGYFVFAKVVVVGALAYILLNVRIAPRLNNGLVFVTGLYVMLCLGHLLIFINFGIQ